MNDQILSYQNLSKVLISLVSYIILLLFFSSSVQAATANICYKTNSELDLDLSRNVNTRAKLMNPAYFGPAGTAAPETLSFTSLGTITEAILNSQNCDIFYGGGSPVMTVAEATQVKNWTENGVDHFVLAGCDYAANNICSIFGRGLIGNSNGGVTIVGNWGWGANPLSCGGGGIINTYGGASTYHGTFAGDVIMATHNGAPAGQTAAVITDGFVNSSTFMFTADADMFGNSGNGPIGAGATASTEQAKFVVNSFKYALDVINDRLENPQCVSSYDQTTDLAITSSLANASLTTGQQTTVTFTVTNQSVTNTSGIEAILNLPTGISYVSQLGSGSYNNGTNIWAIGTLAGNASASITLTIEADAAATDDITGEISNANLADIDSAVNSGFGVDDRNDSIADDDETTQSLTVSISPASYRCSSTVDLWYANDESGSVNTTEFTQARDFIYQVTDGFYHSVTDGAQGGLIGWAYDAIPRNVVIPITENFHDLNDTGLATTGTTVDGDGLGVRETYTAKVSTSSGTQLANATQGLADLINAGNGRRTGVPQVAIILTDAPSSQINNVSGNGGGTAWEAAAANLRAAGPDGTRIVVILLAEAADAYDNNTASQATIEAVIGTTGFVIKTSSYANAADATKGYIDMAIDGICGAATIPVTDDYSDAPTTYGDAIHAIVNELKLGTTIDPDSASLASTYADGDGADDDSVSTFRTLVYSDRIYSIDTAVTNQTGSTARLIAWIDFDGNGSFDPDEAAIRSIPTGTNNGTVTLNWSSVPLDIQSGNTFVRLRLTTDPMTNGDPDGAKNDGEVEDYFISISDAGATVSGRVYIDANSNANQDINESGIGATIVVLRDTVTGTCSSISTNGSGHYSFSGIADSSYELYQAHGETTPIPQNCGASFSNNPVGFQSTTSDTLTITVTGSDITDKDFGEVAGAHSSSTGNTGVGIRFEPDHQSEILPGNVTFYAHTFTSEADGSVRFTTSGNGNTAGNWSHSLYRDSNCNGTLNGAEGNVTINGINLGIAAGGRLCIIDKVYAPSNVPARDRYKVQTTATFAYNGNALPSIILKVSDLTIAGQTVLPATQTTPLVGESRLVLTKTVENITQRTSETKTLNVAKPGDTLKYRLYYSNTGTGSITDLVVDDQVPAYAGFVSGSNLCVVTPVDMACTPSFTVDKLNWGFSGALVGGASGSVSYEVIVDN